MQICILALVLTTLLTAGVAQAAAVSSPTWSIVPSPDGGLSDNSLLGVAALSATDIWTVGYSANNSGSVSQTLIEHWNGTSWQVVPSPNASAGNLLRGVAWVPGGTSLWAVGEYGDSSGVGHTLTEFSG